MNSFLPVWGFIAFSILGFRFLPKAETFILQDFESNFEIVSYPEEFLPGWAANEVRTGTSRVFQAPGEGLNGSHALGIQTISSFDAQIYIKTSTIGLKNNNISFFAKTRKNGNGNRPVRLSYRFIQEQTESSSEPIFIGEEGGFPNADTPFQEYSFSIPEGWMNLPAVTIQISVHYGEGNGSAARFFIDNFVTPRPHAAQKMEETESEIPFTLHQVRQEEVNALVLEFSHELAGLPEKYLLSPAYGTPSHMEINGKSLIAWFEDYLYPNRYSISLEGLSYKGNLDSILLTHDFELETPLPRGSLVINEFMADPNPKALPPPEPTFPTAANDEYIEVWNSTGKPIWLRGLTYNGSAIEEFTMESGEYILLTPFTRKDNFSTYAKVAGVSGFRALPNNSGHISIKGAFGEPIDSLSYDLSWYNDTQKAQGGWSLERINPYLVCSDATNWTASTSAKGGTPGVINSVYTDELDDRPFDVLSVLPLSEQRLELTFSKPLPMALNVDQIGELNGNPLLLDSLVKDQLWARINTPMVEGNTYRLELFDFSDCNGQMLSSSFTAFVYDTQAPTIQFISGLDEHGFLVHFNKNLADTSYALQQFSITQNEIVNFHLEKDSVIFFRVKESMVNNKGYTFTALNISDQIGNIADSLYYNWVWEDHLDTVFWVNPTVLGVKFGSQVSLETAKDPQHYWLDKDMGHPEKVSWIEESGIFHLFFGRQFPANTPMTLRVQGISHAEMGLIQTLSKIVTWDTRAISVTSFSPDQPGKIYLSFNKPLDAKWAALTSHYQVDQGVGEPEKVEMISSEIISLHFSELWENGQDYRLSIRQLKDLFGQSMSRTINVDFVWDTLPPVIGWVHILSPHRINVYLNKGILEPEEVLVNGRDVGFAGAGQLFSLESVTPWAQGLLDIRISGAKDERGNPLSPLVYEADNTTVALGEVKIWGEREVQLFFTQHLPEDQVYKPDQFSVNGIKPLSVKRGESGFDFHLGLIDPLQRNEWIRFTYSSAEKDAEILNPQISIDHLYEDAILDLWAESSKSIQVLQEVPVDIELPWLGDFTFIDRELLIHPIVNQSDPTRLQLIMEGPLPVAEVLTLQIPPRIAMDGKWLAGSTRTVVWDPSPPNLVEVEVISTNEFMLFFDKPLSPIFSVVPQFYTLEGQFPVEVIPGENLDQVLLVFEQIFEPTEQLILEITGVEDQHGNSMEPTVFHVKFEPPKYPGFRDLVINEIMTAPRPNQELPNVEYIEIYNPSSETLYLGGMKIANSRSYSHLPRKHLLPHSYLILCPLSQVHAFKDYGEVVGLSPWPTLLNAGDEVSLLSAKGEIIDRLEYSSESFGGSEFAQGGYSLELVNPYYACTDADNIQVSRSLARGTPGKVNSVYDPNQMPALPLLLKVESTEKNRLILHFSKPVFNVSNALVEISPYFEIESIVQDSVHSSIIRVNLKKEIEKNQVYTIKAKQFMDCTGNALDPSSTLAHLIIPGTPEKGDLVINEVLFNPKVGTPKFVELYNAADKYINLKHWKLANVTNAQVSNQKAIFTEDRIISPGSFLVLTPDPDQLISVYPHGNRDFMSPLVLPSYPIGSGSVVLLDPEEEIVERFDYHENMHHGFLREVRGVSLERYSPKAPVDDPHNWHSASSSSGYATPGLKNSSVYRENPLEKGLQISPEVFIPDAAGEKPFTTISYLLEDPGYLATLRIYGVTGRLVRELCHNALWGQEGFYTWDGTDAKGVRVSSGYYILWAELHHPNGQVHQLKKTVVVASKLR
jgi:hypothetical protein